MKLNFWQILGLILIVAAVVLIFRREANKTSTTMPTTQQTP
jgi:hypothetical protein